MVALVVAPTPLIERARFATGGAQNPADFVVGTRDVKELLLPLG